MGRFQKYDLTEFLKWRGLPGWLEIATDKLAESARQRISQEMEAHFAEAVKAHVEAGQTESEAQAMALAELGDPQDAARSFKKSHLTEKEAEWLQKEERRAGNRPFSFANIGIWLVGLIILLAMSLYPEPVPHYSWVIVLLQLTFIGTNVAPRLLRLKFLSRPDFRRALVFAHFCGMLAAGVAAGLFMVFSDHDFFMGIGFFLLFGWINNPALRIWWKMRNQRDEFPPAAIS
jgi:uncharacterized membrane protein